jgi:hypothetical protein
MLRIGTVPHPLLTGAPLHALFRFRVLEKLP